MQILTTDCPFEGSPCAGSWPGFAQTSEHRGLADSQPAQDIANQEFYKTLRSRFNTFLRVPDPCKPHLVCKPSRAGFDHVDISWAAQLRSCARPVCLSAALSADFLSSGVSSSPIGYTDGYGKIIALHETQRDDSRTGLW